MYQYPYYYQSLATSTDISNCMSSNNPSTDPLGFTNCVRAAFNLPPVSAGTIPTVDNDTLTCLQGILSQYTGPVDSNGTMHLPFQTVIDMVDKVRACVGLPALPIPALVTCIMNTCLAGTTPGTPADISACVNNCIKANPL